MVVDRWIQYPRTILKLSFGTAKMAAYANKLFVCLFITKYGNVNQVEIILSTPYKIDNYWYNLFDLISSLANEHNGYSLIWGHIRRVYNNQMIKFMNE